MLSQILFPSLLDPTDYPNPLYQDSDEKVWNGHEVKKIKEAEIETDFRDILIPRQIVVASLPNPHEYSNPLYEDSDEEVWANHEVKKIEESEITTEQIEFLLKNIEQRICSLSDTRTMLVNSCHHLQLCCQRFQLDVSTQSLFFPHLSNSQDISAARDDFMGITPSIYDDIDISQIKFAITYIFTKFDQESLLNINRMKKIVRDVYEHYLLHAPKKSLEIAKLCIEFDSDLTNEISMKCYLDLITGQPDLAWDFVKMNIGKKNKASQTTINYGLDYLFMDISDNILHSTTDFLVNYLRNRLGIDLNSDRKFSLKKINSTLIECKKIKTENDALKIIESQSDHKSETFLMIVEMLKTVCEVKEIKLKQNWKNISLNTLRS